MPPTSCKNLAARANRKLQVWEGRKHNVIHFKLIHSFSLEFLIMVCSLKIKASYAKPEEIPYSYKIKPNTFKTIHVQFGSHYDLKMLLAFPIHCVKHQTPPHLCRAVNHSRPQSGSFLSFPSSTQKENFPKSLCIIMEVTAALSYLVIGFV